MRAVVGYGLVALFGIVVSSWGLWRAWRVTSGWTRALPVEVAGYHGSATLYLVATAYDLDLEFTKEDGTAHTDSALFLRFTGRPMVDAFGLPGSPYEIRAHPTKPNEGYISWEYEGRYEAFIFFGLFLVGSLGLARQAWAAAHEESS